MAEPTVGRTLVRFLMPGSFNPITLAHMRMLELAKDFVSKNPALELEKGVISPVGNSYGEKKNLQPANLRLEMCRRAVRDTEWLMVDDWEAEQNTWVRTLDGLQRQQELIQDLDPVPHVMLLCGADLIQSFSRPGLWSKDHIDRIISEFGILVISRKGAEDFQSHVPTTDPRNWTSVCSGIHVMEEWIPNEISSTKVRFGIKNGLSVRHVIPDPVLKFITERKLYETEPE